MSILKLKIAGGGTSTPQKSFTTPQDLYINASTILQIGYGLLMFQGGGTANLVLSFECSEQEALFAAIEQALSANPGGSIVNVQLPEGVNVEGATIQTWEV